MPFEVILNTVRCAKTFVITKNTNQRTARCPELVQEGASISLATVWLRLVRYGRLTTGELASTSAGVISYVIF
eukprot:6199479-Pleurochrysis_carterae.AAC.1